MQTIMAEYAVAMWPLHASVALVNPRDARFTPSRLRDLVERPGTLEVAEALDRRAEECHHDQCAGVIHEQPAIAGTVTFRAHLPQPRK